jgi:hypothetical protein
MEVADVEAGFTRLPSEVAELDRDRRNCAAAIQQTVAGVVERRAFWQSMPGR